MKGLDTSQQHEKTLRDETSHTQAQIRDLIEPRLSDIIEYLHKDEERKRDTIRNTFSTAQVLAVN